LVVAVVAVAAVAEHPRRLAAGTRALVKVVAAVAVVVAAVPR
jgi:hypothetical protein